MRNKAQSKRVPKGAVSDSSSFDLMDVNVLTEKKAKGFQPWWKSWVKMDCINSPHTEAFLREISAQVQGADSKNEE